MMFPTCCCGLRSLHHVESEESAMDQSLWLGSRKDGAPWLALCGWHKKLCVCFFNKPLGMTESFQFMVLFLQNQTHFLGSLWVIVWYILGVWFEGRNKLDCWCNNASLVYGGWVGTVWRRGRFWLKSHLSCFDCRWGQCAWVRNRTLERATPNSRSCGGSSSECSAWDWE